MRPLLDVTREETSAYCAAHGLEVRVDATNPETARGLIRDEILPLLRQLHPGADANLRALGDERPRLPRALEARSSICSRRGRGRKAADLGGGVRAVREYETLRLEGTVSWGPWTLETERDDLEVRARRPGDHLAGRRKKVQDLFVDAKVPRAERDAWPVVVCAGEVVAVPGIADAPGLGRRRHRPEESRMSEIDHGVGEILIEEEAVKERVARARGGDLGRLRRPRPAARRSPQGRGLLHGRPDARALDPVRDRLHGDLELRRRDRFLRGRAHPQGPRHQHRRPRRPRGRGHHRLGADALVPDAQPAGAQARLARGLRPPDEARSAARSTFRCGTSASRSRTSS